MRAERRSNRSISQTLRRARAEAPGRVAPRTSAERRKDLRQDQRDNDGGAPNNGCCRCEMTHAVEQCRLSLLFTFIHMTTKHRIFTTSFASVYPSYVAKAERKGRTK